MPKTNVLLVLTDDQGPWAAGCCGNREIQTPHIDRLAATGTRFDNFFVATPVCSPSRATLLTGLIPSQHGIHDWLKGCCLGPKAHDFLAGKTACTDVLAAGGWTCGLSGKWHVGDSHRPQHGFSDWFVAEGGRYYGCRTVRDGRIVEEPGYITDAITDRALANLDRYAAGDSPFYLSVHYTAPHSPWIDQHPEELTSLYDDCPFETCPQDYRHPWAKGWINDQHFGSREALKGYFASVTGLDAGVGRLLDRLEELGLRENTLVVFLSDNGHSCGQHGFWGKGNGTSPRNLFENSVKVPAIFSQPERIPSGRVESAMVSAYDFAPTLLDYLDLTFPAGGNLPGRSFLPVLEGKAAENRESVVIFDEYGPVRMVRTREWKYVHRHPEGPHELYDMLNDPEEARNLAGEPGQGARIKELKAIMDEWFARYLDPRLDGLAQDGNSRGQTGPVG